MSMHRRFLPFVPVSSHPTAVPIFRSRLVWALGLLCTAVALALWHSQPSTAAPVGGAYTSYLPVLLNQQRPSPIHLTLFAVGFDSDTITDMAFLGDGRFYVAQRQGIIRLVNADGTVQSNPVMNISPQIAHLNWEQGLLGLALHPNYPATPYLFVSYTSIELNRIHISRFTIDPANPQNIDYTTELILLTIDKPLPAPNETPSPVHNGGDLVFGDDGYLYIATGDGGPDPHYGSTIPHDPDNNGYRTDRLLGKILRIDVNGGGAPPPDACGGYRHYTIPAGNPFADGTGPNCDEIWAKGLRNPWRFSFDRQTGDMFIADVGEWIFEEINYAPAGTDGGRDYGWRCFEGTYDQRGDHPDIAPGCAPNPMQTYTFPVYEYDQQTGCSVVGGFVYRGAAYPGLNGHYFFGDFCNGLIRTLTRTVDGRWVKTGDVGVGFHISTFAEDPNGEIYVGQWSPNGFSAIYKLHAP